MILKIQTLQKRLIAKTEEVMEKDLLIQEKERLYVELKNILARQPGPEVAEQLNVYQETLRKKTGQMKAMTSELNFYQFRVKELKYEKERMTQELEDIKRKYYSMLNKSTREKNRATAQGIGQTYPLIHPTGASSGFVGGGFNVNA